MRGRVALLFALLTLGCARHLPSDLPPLRVGTSGDYPPFSIGPGRDLRGFDVEVARRFASDTRRRLEFVPLRWPELLADLESGRFDVAMSGVTIRPERALVGTFTRPVTDSGAIVIIRPEFARSTSRVDLVGMRIGVNAGGHLERVGRRLFPRAILVPSRENQSLPALLVRGSVEAILTDDLEAAAFGDALSGFHRVGPLTHDRKAYLARDPLLAAELDEWLRNREADGTLSALRMELLGAGRAGPASRFESDMNALVALIDLRLAFMPLVAAAKGREGRPIADPAREAQVLDTARAEAQRAGLAPDAATQLFRALIAAARAVQADSAGPTGQADQSDLNRDLRPAITAVSAAIVDRAAAVASSPAALGRLDPARLADRLDAFVTPAANRVAIATAILALRRSDARPAPPRAAPPTTDR